MTRQHRHPAYTAFMVLLVLLCLIGAALLVWGATHQGPLPHPGFMMVPPQVHHG